MSQVIKPKRLNKGDTIGIISPSQTVNLIPEQKEGFRKGIENLKNVGFNVKLGKFAQEQHYYSAGTPEQRAQDFHEMLRDPEVKAILMSLGGETENEVLPLVDFELIRNNPKILMGMSDGTTLLAPITDKTGLVTFYGPDLIYGFGIQKDTEKFDQQIWDSLMTGEAKYTPLSNLVDDEGRKMPEGWLAIRPGTASGQLIGGYLETVMALIGAKYLNNLDGKILFLESMEGSNTIHMRLQFLNLMGVFNRIKGLILGYFPDIKNDEKFYREIGEIMLDLTKGKNFPILQVNEMGHLARNYAWAMGIETELDATKKTIQALEKCII